MSKIQSLCNHKYMQFRIEKGIFEQHPDLKIGFLIVRMVDNSRRNSALESLLRGICAQKIREIGSKDLKSEEKIKVWNQAYGRFGINPEKYPCSAVKLINKLKDKGEISHVNPIVDICNYFSLKYLLPIRADDLDCLCGDLVLQFTKGGESFRKMDSIDVMEASEGEVAYMDKGGIISKYWNHNRCERTKVTSKTMTVGIFVEDLSKMHMDAFGTILNEMALAISKYIGGQIEPSILNEEGAEMEIGVQGRVMAQDGKVPQQEKNYFLEMQKLKKKQIIKEEKVAVEKKKKIAEDKKSAKSKKEIPEPTPEQITLFMEENGSLNTEDKNTQKQRIKFVMEKAIIMAFPQVINPDVKIENATSPEYGDYACNIAMHLTKILGLSPKEIAEKIIKKIPQKEFRVEIAGPGFINFFLPENVLKDELKKILKEKDLYGKSSIGKEKTIVMDYSSPNIAKPLGVHHLLSTIIGQSIYNIFESLGFKCVAVNHIGDWGTQFGKLIYAYKKWGKKEEIDASPIPELLKLYVKFHDEAEKNPHFEDGAREEFKKFEEGDEENRALWKWFVDESMKEIEKTYNELGGVKFDFVMGESFYEDKMEDILKEGKEREIFVRGDEGSYVVNYDDPNMAPFVVQKKDGATLYSTRDFSTLKYRITRWRPARALYVVDVAQSLHFRQLFTAAKRFPWYHGEGEHVIFGRMQMKDGKMSTRKGNVVLLDEVLEEAIKRSLKLIEEKSPNLPDKELAAKKVGIGAVKYSILSQNRTTDITFDWDKMLALDGNSSPYLQYSYARAKSILRKAKEEITASELKKDPENIQKKIDELVRIFPKYPEQVSAAAQEYKPNLISNYLYELAQNFNSFYNSVPVLKAYKKTDRNYRLKIVEATAGILKNGLKLLGIEVLEEM
ncbi:MAG: arginine--tRNA ligase [Candidatus Gracilibacteria bacterium]|nr:arginine--tRNA ligase [Candidatus Gracilibacteria bacterium]